MIDNMLSLVAPHLCCGCGSCGKPLCDNCKYNIISELGNVCLVCRRPCGVRGICTICRVPYDQAWCAGDRREALQKLIGLYKFERVRAAYRNLGDLLLATIPELPPETIVVPVPTVAAHIRERGYDHMLLIARYFAKKRGLQLSRVLGRATSTKQRQASARAREAQAKAAFEVKSEVWKDVPYLLIDDIMTTGSTLKYTAKALKDAGATSVWVAVVSRQPLD